MGSRGPSQTPAKVLEKRGSWRAKTREGQASPPPVEAPKPPPMLDRTAKAEWRRVAKLLVDLQMVSLLDRAALTVYCQGWSDFVSLTKQVQEEGHVVIGKSGDTKRNPALVSLIDARTSMMAAAVKLGLNPVDRARMLASISKPKAKEEEGDGYID